MEESIDYGSVILRQDCPHEVDATGYDHGCIYTSTEESRRLMDILTDKRKCKVFEKFLDSILSPEPLEFFLEIERYKSLRDPLKLRNKAIDIQLKYFVGEEKINFDAKALADVKERMQRPINKDVFSAAQKRAFLLMLRDSYPRFVESRIYLQEILKINPDEVTPRKVAFADKDDAFAGGTGVSS